MGRFFTIFWLLAAVAMCCCNDPRVKVLKAYHPDCDVLRFEEDNFGREKAILQCPGNRIKEVPVRKPR